MLTKIQLSATAECDNVIDYIFSQVNETENTIATIQRCYSEMVPALDGVKSYIVNQYGSYDQFVKKRQAGVIDTMASLMTSQLHDPFMKMFNRCVWYKNDGKILVPLTFCPEKLEGFDLFVGYAAIEEDFDTEHLETHEGLSKESAVQVMRFYNEWLVKNKSKFDVFIENKTKEEAVEIIKSL